MGNAFKEIQEIGQRRTVSALRLGLSVPVGWTLTLTTWDGEQFFVRVGAYYDKSKKFVYIEYIGGRPEHVQEKHIFRLSSRDPYTRAGEFVPVDWLIQRLHQG